MTTATKPQQWTYESLKSRLHIDQLAVEKEIIEQPILLQTAAEKAAEFGAQLAKLRVQEKEMEAIFLLTIAQEAAAEATKIATTAVTAKAPKGPTVAEKSASVNAKPELIAIRNQIIDVEYNYNLWWDLRLSYKERGESLTSLRTLIVSGYMEYKKHS